MSDHDKSAETGGHNANSSQFQRSAPDVRAQFNLESEYGARIAALSEEGRKNVQVLAEHGQDRLEREARNQQGSRRFREIQEENRRLKEVLQKPELKLGEIPFDGRSEIEFIENSAKENVARREQAYRDNIRDDVRYSIDKEIAADADRRRGGPEQTQDRDQERDR